MKQWQILKHLKIHYNDHYGFRTLKKLDATYIKMASHPFLIAKMPIKLGNIV